MLCTTPQSQSTFSLTSWTTSDQESNAPSFTSQKLQNTSNDGNNVSSRHLQLTHMSSSQRTLSLPNLNESVAKSQIDNTIRTTTPSTTTSSSSSSSSSNSELDDLNLAELKRKIEERFPINYAYLNKDGVLIYSSANKRHETEKEPESETIKATQPSNPTPSGSTSSTPIPALETVAEESKPTFSEQIHSQALLRYSYFLNTFGSKRSPSDCFPDESSRRLQHVIPDLKVCSQKFKLPFVPDDQVLLKLEHLTKAQEKILSAQQLLHEAADLQKVAFSSHHEGSTIKTQTNQADISFRKIYHLLYIQYLTLLEDAADASKTYSDHCS